MPRFWKKKNENKSEKAVENKNSPSSISKRVAVSDIPAAKTPTEKRTGKTSWLHRLFGRPANKENGQCKDASCHDPATTTAAESIKSEKSSWSSKIFACCRRNNRVAPAAYDKDEQRRAEKPCRSPVEVPDETHTADEVDEVLEFKAPEEKDEEAADNETEKEQRNELPFVSTSGDQEVLQPLCNQDRSSRSPVTSTKRTHTADELPVVPECKTPKEEDEQQTKKQQRDELHMTHASGDKSGLQTLANPESSSGSADTHHIPFIDELQIIAFLSREGQHDWLGFPNTSQICYMNSSLQSLITLADFIRDISYHEEVWASVHEAELIRRFMNIVCSHRSSSSHHKIQALNLFKRTLSVNAPEFLDNHQKDAHEFQMTVLGQIRALSPLLQEAAARVGRTYSCPVEDHLVFRMQITRTCKSCGIQSRREEDFNCLSLSLVPGGSIQDMLQQHLIETEVDFRCECGATKSWQHFTFATLPRVLMVHLKRFCFTPHLQLQKVNDSISLFRELLVNSSQDNGWYSLVSVISHLGYKGNSGHYISDGVHPDAELDDFADRWLTYNDSEVTETTGDSVCKHRQETAYILYYQRQM